MKRIHNTALSAAALICALSVSSCLQKNDLAYPDVRAVISEFEVRGQTSAKLDPAKQTITVTLKEETDIKHQKLTKFKYAPTTVDMDTVIMKPYVKVGDTLDLSSDYKIKFTIYYRDSVWTVITKQPIERYIKTEGMIDSAKFDTGTCQATVDVIDTIDLSKINIQEMKLGQKGSKIYTSDWKACEFPMTLDCRTAPVFYSVSKYQDTTKWTVTFVKTKVTVQVKSVNAWTSRAYIDAMFSGKGTPVLEYSEDGGKEWMKISSVKISGTSVRGTLTDLTQGSDYQVRISAAADTSKIFTFSTEKEAQIQNMSYDEWQQVNEIWYPKPGKGTWDTPNSSGMVTVTSPEEQFLAVNGANKKAAKLLTKFVGIFGIGKLSAGTIFSGSFIGTEGVGAVLDWGTPFTSRPKTLKGYFAYEPKEIDHYESGYEAWAGKTDSLQLLVILADWDKPFTVNTSKGTYLDQENDPGIIAKGHLETSEHTLKDGKLAYKSFEFPIEYRDTVRKPKWVVVISCSSFRGDRFCGAEGSTLYVDELKFTY